MPPIERFVHQHTGRDHTQLGEIALEVVSFNLILSTRPFLTIERLQGRQRRHGFEFPQLVLTDGLYFCADGHHKIRRQLDENIDEGFCRILTTSDRVLIQKLRRMNHGLITNLPIRWIAKKESDCGRFLVESHGISWKKVLKPSNLASLMLSAKAEQLLLWRLIAEKQPWPLGQGPS